MFPVTRAIDAEERRREGERERKKRNEEEKNFIRKFDKGSPRIFCETGEILRSYLIARQTSTPESWLPYNVPVLSASFTYLWIDHPLSPSVSSHIRTYVCDQGGHACTCINIISREISDGRRVSYPIPLISSTKHFGTRTGLLSFPTFLVCSRWTRGSIFI